MFAFRITSSVWQGMQPQGAADYRSLWASGVTGVISVNAENPYEREMYDVFGERALWITWQDDHQPKDVAGFEQMYTYMRGLGPKDRVYVHCSAGISRSTLAATWLICCQDTDISARAAWEIVLSGNRNAIGMLIPSYRSSLFTARSLIMGISEPVYESAFGEIEDVAP